MRNIILLLVALSSSARASQLFSGVFSTDDQVQLIDVAVTTAGTLTVRSAGYGGDPTIGLRAGGFDTDLSLFSASGLMPLLAENNDGGCPPAHSDPATGNCFDAVLSYFVTPGNYVAALTEFDNLPNGPFLADGFSEQGNGNFTPGLNGCPGVSFVDETCSQRTGSWTLILSGGSVTTTPEPGTLGLCGIALASSLVRMARPYKWLASQVRAKVQRR
jgi:hypothetical protein